MSKKCLALVIAIGFGSPALAQPVGRPADPSLAAVPTDAFAFASVRVSRIWDNPAAKPLRDWYAAQKPGPLVALAGLHPADVDRVTAFRASWDPEVSGGLILLVTTRKPYNEATILEGARGETGRPMASGGGAGAPSRSRDRSPGSCSWTSGPSSISRRTLRTRSLGANLLAQLIARKPDGPLAAALVAAQAHDVTVGVDMRGVQEFAELIQAHRSKEAIPFLSLLKARTATLTVDIDKTARGQFTLTFPDAETARRAAPVLEEGIKFLHTQWSAELASREDGLEKIVAGWTLGVMKSAKVAAVGTSAVATADVPFAEELVKLVAVLPKDFGVFQTDTSAINNLKQLAIAMHATHDVYNGLLGDVGSDGKTKSVSWRVMALPLRGAGQPVQVARPQHRAR